ncbi:hypothetical protein N9B21_01885 [Verrucomicrobiales bacterium]|jgi:tRNA-modifying protein YgfZ|nr:hypothetical protein [Verrucomicrobiales bacterium]MDA7926766.1 hypothetical protein [Verrucomicrobiales bacterium]|tara:strand:+ start:1944 stop:2780 length:837 start_codon:yes stop_codon:yes gene_type:complete
MKNAPKSPIEEGNWIQLEERAVFRLTGPDRVRYLNGQVSNDVALDLEANAIAACVCTLKGKVEALVWISSDGDSLIIDGELGQREELFARLDRYLIADDCELHDITGELTLIHHFNQNAPGIPSRRSLTAGKDLWIPPSRSHSLSEKKQLSPETFQFSQLLAKIPKANCEITANEFPAELGLDTWAVNFHKGCYLGQEVISRIESVGRVKRALILATTDQSLPQGTNVITEANANRATGITTRASQPSCAGKELTLTLIKYLSLDSEPMEPIEIQISN